MTKRKRQFNRGKKHSVALRWGIGLSLLVAGIFTLVYTTSLSELIFPQQFVRISMTSRYYPTFQALTKGASLVVVGHIVGNGTTTRISQPVQVPHAFQPASTPVIPAAKATLIATSHPAVTQQGNNTSGADQGLPETTFTFQVAQVLKGTPIANHQISVFQSGGTVSEPIVPGGPTIKRTYLIDEEPLLLPGEEVVLFLDRANDSYNNGSYYIIGGAEGRFIVSQGRVHPFLSDMKNRIGHDGDTLTNFFSAVSQ